MLEDLIKKRINEIADTEERNNKDIQILKIKSNNLIEELRKTHKHVANELDVLIGEYMCIYSEIFFDLGFKDGIKFNKEIEKL